MQIKEVSKQTGLTIKTIRFYGERGLITPKEEWKNGKTFRTYSETDLERLRMIAVLRKCLFSIDQIKTMIEYPELTPDIFTEYRVALETQRDLLSLLADKACALDPETLDSPETLARRLTTTAAPLPLPTTDMAPHFGKLDPETPEQRQAAFLKWKKQYPYRHIRRWALPVLTLILLMITTLIQANIRKNNNISIFLSDVQRISSFSMEFTYNYPQNGAYDSYDSNGLYYDMEDYCVYGLYDEDGVLLPQPSEVPSTLAPEEETAEVIVADVVRDHFDNSICREKPKLQEGMEQWMATRDEPLLIRSSLFSQTMAAAHEIAVLDTAYTLVIYSEQHPLGYVWGKVWMFYMALGLLWGLVFAFKTTNGYSFRVNVFRQYGPRGTWTDGIISVDQETGQATLMTKGTAGHGTLVKTKQD